MPTTSGENDSAGYKPGATAGTRTTVRPLKGDVVPVNQNSGILDAGSLILNRYVIDRVLGYGGCGMVYLCASVDDPQTKLALKTIKPNQQGNPTLVARFEREVRIASRINHPHAIRIYEFIQSGDLLAYTMELCDGGTLADSLNQHGIFDLPTTISVLSQLCLGLQAIHESNVIHRDLKPSNIFLSSQGMIKIGDFGISKIESGTPLTRTGEIVGTYEYMSPEMMSAKPTDKRSDIYSLGVIAYRMITGKAPFSGEAISALMQRLEAKPPPPHVVNPDCPLSLSVVIQRAMEPEPQRRFNSVRDMMVALKENGVWSFDHSQAVPEAAVEPDLLTRVKRALTYPLRLCTGLFDDLVYWNRVLKGNTHRYRKKSSEKKVRNSDRSRWRIVAMLDDFISGDPVRIILYFAIMTVAAGWIFFPQGYGELWHRGTRYVKTQWRTLTTGSNRVILNSDVKLKEKGIRKIEPGKSGSAPLYVSKGSGDGVVPSE